MEKYAVDQGDQVEKKASELVKTGGAKDMNDARKIESEKEASKHGNPTPQR